MLRISGIFPLAAYFMMVLANGKVLTCVVMSYAIISHILFYILSIIIVVNTAKGFSDDR